MKQRYVAFLLMLFCSGLSYGVVNDDDPLKAFLQKLEEYRNKHQSEKIHIHTDKPYYSIGDTIWFKSYVVSAESNQLSALSKVVYVELINERDSVKKALRLPLVAGLAWGDFTLSDSLSEGNYRLRAYTNWMRNFDEAYFFDKVIKIGNSFSSEVVSDVSYSYSKTGVREHVDANITYKTLKGEPLQNKDVSYNIELDHRKILSGSGKTDNLGNLKIRFTNAQPFILKSGKINTQLKIDDKTLVSKSFPVKATSSDIDVQFFSESGSLVTNIRTKVAFKAMGADGLGKKITGYVKDSEGNKIAELNSEYAGMGSFSFTPLSGKTYEAIVSFEDGTEKTISLPRATSEGYVISVSDTDDESISIRILASVNVDMAQEDIILLGQQNGVVHYMSRNKLNNSLMSAKLSKKRFPSGIIQFTLFNKAFQPLAERLVFIQHPPGLTMKVSTEKEDYKAREKVNMSFLAVDSVGKASQGAFSVSVINESQVPFDDVNETTILSNLLLSSELRGYIETPNYYFVDATPAKRRMLDNLMLTQGWRKFAWKDITSGNSPHLVFKPEVNLSITGRVVNYNGTPAAGANVTLLTSAGTVIVMEKTTDALGRFAFSNLSFNDSTSFIIQARTVKGKKNVDIEIDRIPRAIVTKSVNAAQVEVNVNQSLMPYLATRSEQFAEMREKGLLGRSILLAEVKVIDSKPKAKNSSNLNGAGNADAILTATDLRDCQSLVQCIHGRVAGLIVQNGIAYLTRNMQSSFSGPVPMQLIIDGMYVEPGFLSSIYPGDVESIEVLKSIGNTAIYGIRGGGGVLIITTKRGERNLSARNTAPGVASFSPQGLYAARQFYSPKYDQPSISLPDWRSTIFWTPNILTDTEGKASVEFFTADKPGTYKAVIEGLDLKGSLVRQIYRFSVK
ncbi:carboxypeptidase regulatory-like domain-containing protein [Paradesertivirga mongoliensis]|uniref:Carboxypeptidase regulatory-like domain-containing protein n=1 Tax=Paradesertivirga mongoliensis TaxID=2100740 RepID=A0ABW4ZH42_9SPHI|nr:carboxypeptidase regulatory-like domain-containing protein [Pedobacter mongoliensis]